MTPPETLPPLRDVIRSCGLEARKGLGQNFLLDMNLTRRIARAAGPLDGKTVLEIGPGPGGLTRSLLAEGAQRVIAIEQDLRCVPALEQIAAAWPGRLDIVSGDARALDHRKLVNSAKAAKVVGNLPYNIATPLLIGWLLTEPWPPWWESLTLMFQREVAERITAVPGTKAYGRLSVMAQWRTAPAILFNVHAKAFVPPPKITSTLVQITPKAPLDPNLDGSTLEAVVKAAFAQRRKMLRSSLKGFTGDAEALLIAAGIAPTTRADALDVAGYCRLARAWAERAPQSDEE